MEPTPKIQSSKVARRSPRQANSPYEAHFRDLDEVVESVGGVGSLLVKGVENDNIDDNEPHLYSKEDMVRKQQP